MKKICIWLTLLGYVYILWSCANPIPLTGGEKDTTPPKVVKDGMLPKNEQTNFVKQPITFTFDEWVKLENAVTEVVISPPLDKNPEIKLNNKELIFDFDPEEVLKEDVTYTINFGEAIKDLTENNPAQLRYVFSTGDYIDSLIVSGSVVDAITKEPIEDCLVMLHKNLSDTIIRTENPYYFVKTNESGRFNIGNVKEGTYQIFALQEDQGKRYIFDSDTEGIGFLKEPIVITDSTGSGIALQVFKELEELKLEDDEQVSYGHAVFTFNREPYDLEISHEDKGQNVKYDRREKAIHLWYDTEEPFSIYLAHDTLWRDTIELDSMSKAEYLKEASLSLVDSQEEVKKINRQDGLVLKFSTPVATFNNELLSVYADTTGVLIPATLEKDTGIFGVKVMADWKQSRPYDVVLMPGAVLDDYGVANDTIDLSYLMQSDDDFGEIKIVVSDIDSTSNYILKLMTKSNTEKKRYNLVGKSKYEVDIPFVEPGDYKVELVQDKNKNGRWDTGSYDDRTYPEVIYTQSFETLRANWTLEVNVAPGFVDK